jgi:hypothetical protein
MSHDVPRDHTLYSIALGTGLRLQELLGLNVGDVSPDARHVRRRVALRSVTTRGNPRREVFLPARLEAKVRRFLAWKRRVGQSLEPDAPLFVSAQGRRLSPRAAQWRFRWWQERAGFDRRYGFHEVRPSDVNNMEQVSRLFFGCLSYRRKSIGRSRNDTIGAQESGHELHLFMVLRFSPLQCYHSRRRCDRHLAACGETFRSELMQW